MKIDKAGIYPALSIEEYHADCTTGVSISSSGLRDILLECPAKYWARSHLNVKRVIKESKAMDFGSAAHAWILGEPEFEKYFIISPHDDFRKKEAQAWREEQTRTIVKAADMAVIQAMADAIKRTPQTARAFGEGQPEVSIIWQDVETGIWLKSRPDWLPDDPATTFTREYKTAVSIEPRKLSAQAFALGYDLQAAMVFDGLHAVTGKKPLGIAHIVQEKEPPNLCDLRMFAPEQIDIGRARYRHALRIFARSLARMQAGDPPHIAWPGYTTEPQFFSTPKWVTDNLMEYDDEPNHGSAGEFGEILTAG